MKFLLTSLLILLAAPAFADGKITATDGRATHVIDDVRYYSTLNVRVNEGDVIRTGNDGLVHIEMDDGTRLVVGPNSEVLIRIATKRGRVFSNLSIDIIDGTMRFISGDSPKKAYKITTPTGTVEVRGTELDIITTRRTTKSVVYSGMARICPAPEVDTIGGSVELICKRQIDNCVVATTRRDVVARADQDTDLAKFLMLVGDESKNVRAGYRPTLSKECKNRLSRIGGLDAALALPGNDNGGGGNPIFPGGVTPGPTGNPGGEEPQEPQDPQDPQEPVKTKANASNHASEQAGNNNNKGGKERDTSRNSDKGKKGNRSP